MSNDTQPEIRFPEFTDDWEQRKFGLLFEKNLEKNKNSEFDASRTISIATMHFKEEGNGAAESSLATYKVLRVGDIAYEGHTSKQFAFGRFVLNDIGDGIMSPRFTTLRPTSERPISFWKQYIHYEPIMRHLLVRSTKNGTMMNELVIPDLEKESLLVPSESEQKQIGTFFDKLDETITLHQRKLDLLKETKKGFLQKMFPKNGAKVPEIRFPGFTEDWEQSKLGQVANYRRGSFPQPYGNKEWYDGENSMPFVQVVDVGDNLRLVEDTKQKISELAQPKSVFVEEGKVVVTLQGSIGRVAITQYPAYVDRTLLIFENYKAEMDEYYFAYVIQQLFEYEKTRAPGGTIKTITKEALSNFTISFPSIAEQKKLGKFFEQLDDTIALHQRKLDLLKETKKGFLQKMFV